MTSQEMNLLVGQRCSRAVPRAALLYWRDGAWHDLSDRLLFPVTLRQRLRAPATISLTLDNGDGLLARDNQESALNRNAGGQYDPVLDEMRKLRLQQGVRNQANCAAGRPYTCTVPSPSRPDGGGELTNGQFGDPADPEHAGWVGWYDCSPVLVAVDLGSVQPISAVAICCLAATAQGVVLPEQVLVRVATAGATGPYTDAGEMPVDHLAPSLTGQSYVLSLVDLELTARWVRIELMVPSGKWLELDEVAVYHGADPQDLLQTTFTGYLGDAISQEAGWDGRIRLDQVRDTTKRLADAFVEVYPKYKEQPVEEIVRDLLTNEAFGVGCAPEEFTLTATDFVMPAWTSQNQSVLTSCLELARVLGWVFEADAQGHYLLRPLDYDRRVAEHTLTPAEGLLAWCKTASGLRLRNRVVVRSRDTRNREIKAAVEDQASITRYGVRLFALNEPSVKTGRLARQLALSVLRDYSLVGQSGSALARGSALLWPGQVLAAHEPDSTASRPQQLYRLAALEAEQTGDGCGEYLANLSLTCYRGNAPTLIQGLVATPGNAQVSLDWQDSPEPQVTGYRVYRGTQLAGPYSLVDSPQESESVIGGLQNGTQYWLKVTAVDSDGLEGDASGPVPVTPDPGGGPPVTPEQAWQIQGLAAQKTSAWGTEFAALSWGRPSQGMPEAGLYNVYRARANQGPWTLVASVTPSGQDHEHWHDLGIRNPAGTYWWRVSYYDATTGFEGTPASAVSLTF